MLLEDGDVRAVLERFGLSSIAPDGIAPNDMEKTDSSNRNCNKNASNIIKSTEDSDVTLTSSSSCSGSHNTHNTPNADDDMVEPQSVGGHGHEDEDRHRDVQSIDTSKQVQLEEKLKRLEQENRQLRQLVSLNLRSQLLPPEEDKTEEPHTEGLEDELKTSSNDSVSGESTSDMTAGVTTSRKDTLLAALDVELATLLLDVLELKDTVSKRLPNRDTPSPDQVATQSKLAEVASLVNGIHALSMCVKEDAMQMMKHSRGAWGKVKQGNPSSIPQISFLRLSVGDIALFLPTNKKDTFLAFTHELPYYYLSQDSLAHFKNQNGVAPNYIMGQIIFIDERIASNDVPSNIGSANSKILSPGIMYYLLEIVALDFSSK